MVFDARAPIVSTTRAADILIERAEAAPVLKRRAKDAPKKPTARRMGNPAAG